MAFGQVSKQLAIPADATATYTFFKLELAPPGPDGEPRPVKLTCRHVGDGTPGYKRASWHAAQAARTRGGLDKVSEALALERTLSDAKNVAQHCVVSWEDVYEDGSTTPAPCTPEKVLEFLTALIHATEGLIEYNNFRKWAADPETFGQGSGSPPNAGAELGKA